MRALELRDGFTDNYATKCRFEGTVLRGDPQRFHKDLDNFQIRDGDVWLCSFMRSGSTWAKEMIWRIVNDCNLENAGLSRHRFPYFDLFIMNSGDDRSQSYDDILKQLNELPSPRFLKTHLPFHLLPQQLRENSKSVKMVYVTRNPKDVCVSLYYYYKHFYDFKGDLADFCELFLTDKVLYAPYWSNVLSYWTKKETMNILFLEYEIMKTDLPSVIRRVAEFFRKNPTDDQVADLAEYLEFENFRKNRMLNNQDIDKRFVRRFNLENSVGFVRKGTVGQWKTEMSVNIIHRFDDWFVKNLENSDYCVRCT